tara:strand:+ start:1084 stop:1869 length:786 start_codon:yes stop_codon:yes gene_type:complete
MNSVTTNKVDNKDQIGCKPLFPGKKDDELFNFSDFIPTIIAIGFFIYGMILFGLFSGDKWDGNTPIINNKTIEMDSLYIFFLIGFFILFLNNIFNIDKKRKDYYKDKNSSTNVFINFKNNLKQWFFYKIKTFDGDGIDRLFMKNIKYYEYPFNFSIFIGIFIILLINRIIYFKTRDEGAKGFFEQAVNSDKIGFLQIATYITGFTGVLFAIFTNRWVLSKTDDEGKGQENKKISFFARLAFYLIGFISTITVLGSHTYQRI